jgi:hypothetical protein
MLNHSFKEKGNCVRRIFVISGGWLHEINDGLPNVLVSNRVSHYRNHVFCCRKETAILKLKETSVDSSLTKYCNKR